MLMIGAYVDDGDDDDNDNDDDDDEDGGDDDDDKFFKDRNPDGRWHMYHYDATRFHAQDESRTIKRLQKEKSRLSFVDG